MPLNIVLYWESYGRPYIFYCHSNIFPCQLEADNDLPGTIGELI
jgi:hypothetical protein